MRIIINETNRQKIEERIAQAQKRARERKITAEQVYEVTKQMSSRIIDGWKIPKTKLEGSKVFVDLNAQRFPNAYRGTPESTQFWVVFEKGSWRLMNVSRGTTERNMFRVELSQSAEEALLASAKKLQITGKNF